MDLLTELQQRLSGLVVLLPAESLDPAEYIADQDPEGRPLEGRPSGLQVYFRDVAPAGYVQLRHDLGLISNAISDTGLITVEAIAPTYRLADALARQIRQRIGSLPVQPTRFTFSTRRTEEETDYARLILTFQTRDIGV